MVKDDSELSPALRSRFPLDVFALTGALLL